MITINNIFDIADSAMTANQAAMNTVGQNVANVNTPFYNNETPIITEAPSVVGAPYTYGTGVNVSQIQRSTNSFVQSEVNNETTNNGYYTTLYQGLNQIQNLFNDQSGSGFSSAISKFFNDFQNVSNNPSDTAQRTVLLSDARSLSGDINNAYDVIENVISSTNTSIKGVIPEINSLSSQIASLNKQVTYAHNAGGNANELRDERMNAVNKLSKLINISYYENNNGKINISVGSAPLVSSDLSFGLSTKINGKNADSLDVMLNEPGGSAQNITKNINGGSLGAYMDIEHTAVPSYTSRLNSLSAAITDNVNSVQYNGYGLDGSTGNYFFNPDLTTSAAASVTDAVVNTGYVTDPSKLTGDKYSIDTSGAGVFTVTNNTTGQKVINNQTVTPTVNNYGQKVYTLGFDGVSVNITGTSTSGTAPANGDTFTVNQLTTAPAFTMAVNQNLSTSQIAAASAVATAVNPNNTGNVTISAGSVINPTQYTNGTYISGSNEGGKYTIKYTGPGTAGTGDFTVTNNTTNNTQTINNIPVSTNSAGQSEYSIVFGNQNFTGTSGNQAQNFHVTLTGTPSTGDTFTANVLSPQPTGLSLTLMNSIGLEGNNENALNLASLQNNNMHINGTYTAISTYYSGIVSNIGTEAQSANTNYTNSSSVLTNLQNQLSSSVGVNMNEQMTKLVNYQNSYQAAAAITHSAETIMTALLSIVP